MRLRLVLALAVLARASAAAAQVELNVVSSVEIRDEGTEVVVSIRGSKPPNFTTFSMADPPRFVIDLSESRFQGVPDDLSAPGGLIEVVKNLSYGSEATSIARVMIAFTVEVDPPDVQTVGETLLVKIAKPGGMQVAAAAAAGPEAAAQARAQEEARRQAEIAALQAEAERKSREDAEMRAQQEAKAAAREAGAGTTAGAAASGATSGAAAAGAVAGAAAVGVVAAAAGSDDEAARARAEEEARREAEAQARAQADAEAQARREAEAQAQAQADAEAQARREAEAQARAQADAEAQARREAEAQAQAQVGAEAQARREAEAQARAEAEAIARAQAEAAQERAEVARAQPEVERPAEVAYAQVSPGLAERLEAGAPAAQLREIGFQNMPGVSRVFVRTSVTPRFVVQDLGEDTVRIEFENTRVTRRNDTNHLDTSFFPSAVAMITPSRRGTSFVVDIKLRQRVPYQQRIEGDMLAIDFERPAAAAAPAPGAEPAAEPAPEAGAEEPR
jgi:hypothetical protein